MKKLFLAAITAVMVLGMSSCSSVHHTATTEDVNTEIVSLSKADLQISQKKVSYTFYPNAAVRRTGEKNVIRTAVAQALKENGDADVMVATQYEIKKSKNLFGHTKIKYVKVEGYPARYMNFTVVAQ